MQVIVPLITTSLLIHSLSNISSTISSVNNIYSYINTHKYNDYQLYNLELDKTDLKNKLLLMQSMIRDINNRYYFIINNEKISINSYIDSQYLKNINYINNNDNEYDILLDDLNDMETDLPNPLKICLINVLDIINKINYNINMIHNKMKEHDKTYFRYFYKINIHKELDRLMIDSKVFDQRIYLLFEILKLYN